MRRRSHMLLALALVPGIAFAQPPITVEEAWVRAAPPAATVMAGYLVLHNHTRAPVTLTGVRSEQFASVELHRTVETDGVASMEAVVALEIPARGAVALEPGGLHLMLMAPHDALPAGAEVDIEFEFDNGWTVELVAPVRR